jgi:tetratricopeptide (TPR) repeat protein
MLEQAMKHWEKYQELENIEDLDKTIHFARQVVVIVPDDEPDKQNHLNNLAVSLTTRFHHTGNLADLEDAIEQEQRAIELTPEDSSIEPDFLNTLGSSLLIRFQRLGKMEDLDMAICLIQQAIDLAPSGYASTPSYLTNLGNALEKRLEWLGDKTDIDESISVHQQAVDLTPDGHDNKPGYLHNLGTSFHTRFERFGEVADIDRAISIQQQAVDAIPDGHRDKPGFLNNLGNAFLTRFERFGDIADVNQAIFAQQQAIRLTPDDHSRKASRLSNLGNSFLARFGKLGEVADIDEAISVQQQAVVLIPDDDAEKPSCLTNLGSSLDIRFNRLGEIADLDQAIIVEQQAVDLTPDSHVDKPSCLTNLGNSLLSRFERTREAADIDQAISVQRQAVHLTPDDHAGKPVLLKNLGNSLELQFRHTFDHDHFRDAVSSFATSAHSIVGSPHIRLESARRWALLVSEPGLPSLDSSLSSMRACRVLMELIPRVVWAGNSVNLRYQDIYTVSDSISMAASTACSSGFPDIALEWLEQGRSIIWGQMLRLRTPMDDLKRDHPELAASMEDVSRSLEFSSASLETSPPIIAPIVPSQREVRAQRHRQTAEEWESVLEKVRQCSGYEDFLQPPKLAGLFPAAALGPIVVVSVAKSRCDAIMLQDVNGTSKLDHIHLKSASLEKLEKAHRLFIRTLVGRGARGADDDDPKVVEPPKEIFSSSTPPEEELEQILRDLDLRTDNERASAPSIVWRGMPRILQMLWTDIVEPVFKTLGYTVGCIFVFIFHLKALTRPYSHQVLAMSCRMSLGVPPVPLRFYLYMLQAAMPKMAHYRMRKPIDMRSRRIPRACLRC